MHHTSQCFAILPRPIPHMDGHNGGVDDSEYQDRATALLMRDYFCGRLDGSLDLSGREVAGAAEPATGWEPGRTVVLDDPEGDLLGALNRELRGGGGIRVYYDLSGGGSSAAASVRELEWSPELFAGATLVFLPLPRGVEALDDLARDVAAWADEDVVLVTGGRQKYMAPAMNTVLGQYFARVDVSPARSKSRLLIASGRRAPAPRPSEPRVGEAPGEVQLRAWGSVFGGAKPDRGSLLLMDSAADALEPLRDSDARVLDLGSGNGLLTAWLGRELPGARISAVDVSAAAVRSTLATLGANAISAERGGGRPGTVQVRWGGVASSGGPFDLVVCNPPFHRGGAVDRDLAVDVLTEGAKALAPGGVMIVVFNSAMRYRKLLEGLVGPTRQLARDPRFTVVEARRPIDVQGEPTAG